MLWLRVKPLCRKAYGFFLEVIQKEELCFLEYTEGVERPHWTEECRSSRDRLGKLLSLGNVLSVPAGGPNIKFYLILCQHQDPPQSKITQCFILNFLNAKENE